MNKLSACIQLALAAIFAGSSVVAGKIIAEGFPVFLSQGMSLIVALIVLLPAVIIIEGKLPVLKPKDIPSVFLQSLLGMVLFRIFLLYGLKHCNAVESGIITSTTPAFVIIMSYVFLREKIPTHKVLAVIFIVSGVILVNALSVKAPGTKTTLTGIVFVTLAVLGEAMLTILRKSSSESVSPLTGTFYVTLFSFMMFAPVSAIEAVKTDFSAVHNSQWMIILYYGVIVTALAYVFWFSGVAKVAASTAAAYTSGIPASSVVLSFVFLREKVLISHIVGLILVLSGIVFISFTEKEKALHLQ